MPKNITVWEYQLTGGDSRQSLVILKGAKFLTLKIQNDLPTMWFLLDATAEPEQRTFEIVGTGWNMGEFEGLYLGTFFNGPFVFHIFERPTMP